MTTMANLKAFLILSVCLFQVYAERQPIDIKTRIADIFVDFFKEVAPIRKYYLDAVNRTDGVRFVDFVKVVRPIMIERMNDMNKLVKNIESNNVEDVTDEIDEMLVMIAKEGVKAIKNFLANTNQYHSKSYKEFILSNFEDIKKYELYLLDEYDNVILKYLRDRALIYIQYVEDFEALDDDEKVEHFETMTADIQMKLQELQKRVIEDVEKSETTEEYSYLE